MMKNGFWSNCKGVFTALVITMLPTGVFAQNEVAGSQIADSAVRNFVIPSYKNVVVAGNKQSAAMEKLCQLPSNDTLLVARAQFAILVQAWSFVDFVRFGPVLQDNRLERILFWPDRKGTGRKQVIRALGTQDDSFLSLGSLLNKSVAVQGLGALEYILFGAGSEVLIEPEQPFRCGYGQVVAQAITNTASEIVADWQDVNGISKRLRAPLAEYADYRTDAEVLSEILGVFVHGAELVRDTRLKPFLGESAESSRPRLGIFWRSGQTGQSLKANAEGMKGMFLASGMSGALASSGERLADAYIFELDNFSRVANAIPENFEDALVTPEVWQKADYLNIVIQSLYGLMAEQIATGLGIDVGFSALDGD